MTIRENIKADTQGEVKENDPSEVGSGERKTQEGERGGGGMEKQRERTFLVSLVFCSLISVSGMHLQP